MWPPREAGNQLCNSGDRSLHGFRELTSCHWHVLNFRWIPDFIIFCSELDYFCILLPARLWCFQVTIWSCWAERDPVPYKRQQEDYLLYSKLLPRHVTKLPSLCLFVPAVTCRLPFAPVNSATLIQYSRIFASKGITGHLSHYRHTFPPDKVMGKTPLQTCWNMLKLVEKTSAVQTLAAPIS